MPSLRLPPSLIPRAKLSRLYLKSQPAHGLRLKGFVPTPDNVVDQMVEKLFHGHSPCPGSKLLDPGCGTGAFIRGVLRWANRTGSHVPKIIGVDSDPNLLEQAAKAIAPNSEVCLVNADFLRDIDDRFDYIIGNPPYVSITGLSLGERVYYRNKFDTASGRFDLYTLFFEQAMRLLTPRGRLVFITPEKFSYVQSASRLRRQLADAGVEDIKFLPEKTFADFVTYPVVTTIQFGRHPQQTSVTLRQGESLKVTLPRDGSSWLPHFSKHRASSNPHILADAFSRVSCGVATGADRVYVVNNRELTDELKPFAFPTISGRSLVWGEALKTTESMLVPYTKEGKLLPEEQLGALGQYLGGDRNKVRLLQRTCTTRKPWYAFHETPPLLDILRPKILCKDITSSPRFTLDLTGDIVPRHSIYYLVPRDASRLTELCEFLNSEEVSAHLNAHCQRAANGFLRLQSHVLKRIPLPASLAETPDLVCA